MVTQMQSPDKSQIIYALWKSIPIDFKWLILSSSDRMSLAGWGRVYEIDLFHYKSSRTRPYRN